VQSQQLEAESQVFEDEVFARAKRAGDPPEEMPERHNHGRDIIGTIESSFALSHSFCRCTTFWRRHRGKCSAVNQFLFRDVRQINSGQAAPVLDVFLAQIVIQKPRIFLKDGVLDEALLSGFIN